MSTIFCIGRNYAEHAREMGATPDSHGEPVVFLKPAHALVSPPGPLRFPDGAGEIHHETEIVVRVGAGASVEAVALGLDLTDRTRQAEAKKAGLPWAAAKGFRGSAPIGPFVAVADVPALDRIAFSLRVDGVVKQRGEASLMLRPISLLLVQLDRWFGLTRGDLIFTGTPEGVGPIAQGNVLQLDMLDVPAASARFVVA
jgi:2-keto-4-pentenoate hydratase/2-oxohepta-3-ene-1,7-dioic acid hydratase in catechol pathway